MRIGRLVLAAALAAAVPSLGQEIAGDWHGSVEVTNDAPLRLAIHVHRDGSGARKATLDSVDEGGTDLPIDSISAMGS